MILHIENVDLDMLERQRIALRGLHSILEEITEKQNDALEGILNMLDHWSDNRVGEE